MDPTLTNTPNLALKYLKTVFQRVKAYNLVQLFEFITVTFDLYYERRLLANAYSRMDRYIALRYKGLNAAKVKSDDIQPSSDNMYVVKSPTSVGLEHVVDTEKWTCTCTVGRTGDECMYSQQHCLEDGKGYEEAVPTLLQAAP